MHFFHDKLAFVCVAASVEDYSCLRDMLLDTDCTFFVCVYEYGFQTSGSQCL